MRLVGRLLIQVVPFIQAHIQPISYRINSQKLRLKFFFFLLITDEYSSRKELFDPSEGFVEVSRSEKLATYHGQTLTIRLAEDVSTSTLSKNLRLTFFPFQMNCIQFKVDFVRMPTTEGACSWRGVIHDRLFEWCCWKCR